MLLNDDFMPTADYSPAAVNSVSMHLPDVLTSIELGRLDALERVLRIALDARKDFGDWLDFVNKRC